MDVLYSVLLIFVCAYFWNYKNNASKFLFKSLDLINLFYVFLLHCIILYCVLIIVEYIAASILAILCKNNITKFAILCFIFKKCLLKIIFFLY